MAALALVPLAQWHSLWRGARGLCVYALLAAGTACLIGPFARALWNSAAQWTFILVKAFLKIFLSGVFTDIATLSIGTPSFNVQIAPECSGLEGAVLILSFCGLWLWLFRHEFRFPRALLLAPASVTVLFLLNALRIATLILIGNAGAPGIALGGFHSQAGWIAFNGVAIGLMVASRRWQWLTVGSPPPIVPLEAPLAPEAVDNPAAPYLLPFLLILAAGMIASAVSNGFEWLYPLRFFAAAAALWTYRKRYQTLDWGFGWEAPAAGALVFALWMAGDSITGVHPHNPLAPTSDPWLSLAQGLWLAIRLIAPIVTVPIAEELAFRGYLLRRIVAADFESLSPRTFTWTSLLLSSLAFGLLHGGRWIPGTLAALIYAGVYIRRGRIGDAVVAHATTNGLLAASILVTGQWNLS
jgi:exosortase E/protease (VPEID-CTERM system)